jgi:hypothetical protein
MSAVDPAPSGTIIVIGRFGQSSALARVAIENNVTEPRKVRRFIG